MEEYRKNLEKIKASLLSSGTKIAFVLTTPVPSSTRMNNRVILYNQIAKGISSIFWMFYFLLVIEQILLQLPLRISASWTIVDKTSSLGNSKYLRESEPGADQESSKRGLEPQSFHCFSHKPFVNFSKKGGGGGGGGSGPSGRSLNRRMLTKLLCFMLNKQRPCTLFCFTFEIKCFYWLVVRIHFNIFCVLRTVKANEQKIWRTKTYNKETGEFDNECRFVNYGST